MAETPKERLADLREFYEAHWDEPHGELEWAFRVCEAAIDMLGAARRKGEVNDEFSKWPDLVAAIEDRDA